MRISFDILCKNDSNVIASELYLSCNTQSTGSEYGKIRFLDYNQMYVIQGISGHFNLITKPELRLPPQGMIKFAKAEISLAEFVDEDLLLDGVIGADGAAPRSFRFYAPKNALRSFVAKALRSENSSEMLIGEFFNEFLKE